MSRFVNRNLAGQERVEQYIQNSETLKKKKNSNKKTPHSQEHFTQQSCPSELKEIKTSLNKS